MLMGDTPTQLDFKAFDADNHYYEALDAFTRHVPKAMQPRCVQWAEIDGRKYHVVGGKVSRAVVNATFTPIAKAGAMHEYFRGNPNGRNPLDMLKDREPIPDAYRNRDARVRVLDEQGLEACWLFPTLGVLYEEDEGGGGDEHHRRASRPQAGEDPEVAGVAEHRVGGHRRRRGDQILEQAAR